MFYAVFDDARGDVRSPVLMAGPFVTFNEAAAMATDRPCPLVFEWVMGVGWLSVWERQGERFELLFEQPGAELLRERCGKVCG